MNRLIDKIKGFQWFRFFLPILIVLTMIYSSWVYNYLFCVQNLHKKLYHKTTAIVLIVLNLLLNILVLILLLQVVLIGPGRQPKVLPFRILPETITSNDLMKEKDDKVFSTIAPDVYQCDVNGYPIWCNKCNSLKLDRTHHSALLGYCIPRFDHYCVWVGTAVGRRNYRVFVQFIMYFSLYLCIVSISIAVLMSQISSYRRENGLKPNVNVYVVLVLSLTGWVFTSILLVKFVYYMFRNRTSLESLIRRGKDNKRVCYCLYCARDGFRYVVECHPNEQHSVWDKRNYVQNIKEFVGQNLWMVFIPIGTSFKKFDNVVNEEKFESVIGPYREFMSKEFKRTLMEKIERGEYVNKLYIFGDNFN